MNWRSFELKFKDKVNIKFEELAYQLFCKEFNIEIGLHSYKNQEGIETDPYFKDGKNYGFQAKYYSTSLSKNKRDIIDSIIKAKNKNKDLDVIYLYINIEYRESTNKNQKKPEYIIEIEETGKKNGVTICWRTPSMIFKQSFDNVDIQNHFFKVAHEELPMINSDLNNREYTYEKTEEIEILLNEENRMDGRFLIINRLIQKAISLDKQGKMYNFIFKGSKYEKISKDNEDYSLADQLSEDDLVQEFINSKYLKKFEFKNKNVLQVLNIVCKIIVSKYRELALSEDELVEVFDNVIFHFLKESHLKYEDNKLFLSLDIINKETKKSFRVKVLKTELDFSSFTSSKDFIPLEFMGLDLFDFSSKTRIEVIYPALFLFLVRNENIEDEKVIKKYVSIVNYTFGAA